MTTDPRIALEALKVSLDEHLSAVVSRRSESDPSVEAAFFAVADAFESYEDALYDAHEEVLPLELYDDSEDDDDDEND
ncbi:hypothetical protein [Zhihengliuella salsuginis]|uniref:Dehydrogenase n=1 Tax=Zhihengliuella salsuginis TaxID=578222 RepID=A0ABQ3GMC5_9MICC|nr:hypothetical protein [Zhihengliuella salsuginis]GHD13908.1 hypothetical protein GCM10008096_30560 [Zhihengliuella salsuginis]